MDQKLKIKEIHCHAQSPRDGFKVSFVILHYTGSTLEEAIKVFSKADAKVSVHYLIDTNGDIYSIVPEPMKAWHSGVSYWGKEEMLNKVSIGIELVNLDGNLHEYPNQQINSLKIILLKLKKKYNISPNHFLGHCDVSPKGRVDPGRLFPWQELSNNKIGMWYDPEMIDETKNPIEDTNLKNILVKDLIDIGYRITETNKEKMIKAFRLHFNGQDVHKKECTKRDVLIAKSLLKKWY